jgi:hypothetical protein
MVAAVMIGGSLIAGAYSANQQSNAAENAANAANASNDAALAQQQTQFEASQRLQQQLAGQQMAMQRGIAGQQIAEARRQFAAVQQVLQPFITAGNNALGPLQQIQATGAEAMQGQRALLGMNGTDAQGQAIQGLQNSPEMAAYVQQGENSMLQNASATGGLRGGNTQAAMAQFRPQLLAGLISQQYDRLGGLSSLGANTSSMLYQTGQSAAAGVGSAGMQVAGQVGSALAGYSQGVGQAIGNQAQGAAANSAQMSAAYGNYYNNQGAINAGNALAQGASNAGIANAFGGALGSYAALQSMRGSTNPGTAGLSGGGNYNLSSNYQNGGQGLKF